MIDADLHDILTTHRTIAVLGASTERARAGFFVPEYMSDRGYRILPVNPQHAGEVGWGQPFRRSLAELDGQAIDILDVFRRPESLPGHVPEILAMSPLPRVVWFQLGIRNDAAAQRLADAGIRVIQDRCLLAEHRRLGIGRIPAGG